MSVSASNGLVPSTAPPAKGRATGQRERPGVGFMPPFLAELETALGGSVGVMLDGPRGSGKTSAAKIAASRLGRGLQLVQGHADLTVEELRGTPGLEAGSSTFLPGPVVRAAREGQILLFDEVNMCRPGVTAWLNNVLDDQGEVSIPETGERFPVSEDFRAILCFNSSYQGTRPINEALVDRCRVIFCDYWPEEAEVALLAAKLPGLAKIDLKRMVQIAGAIRTARRQGRVDFDFSLRSLYQWGYDAHIRTQSLADSFRSVIFPKVGDPSEVGPQHAALMELARLILA
jgi:midasin (ATPase involved in ribosome maturation)